MTLALVGYGRMGKTLERVAVEQGHRVAAIFTDQNPVRAEDIPPEVEVLVDFSLPEAVLGTVREVAKAGKPLVVGTTGWYDQLEQVRAEVEKSGIGFVYAPNFALGVNLFLRLAEAAAVLFGGTGLYDVAILEMHHAGKADSPSGTALRLAEVVRKRLAGKSELLLDRPQGRIQPHQLHVTSMRLGHVPGEHTLLFDSPDDTVELRHRVRNREIFARGALRAAEWIRGRTGFYTIDDLLDDLLQQEEGSNG